ncbi:hypothetical protein V8C43DRAFT_299420 [Trichoderma afarasin]
MVFKGYPSTACHACRAKRLKCNRVQTGCSQCARKNMTCPGYRNAVDLLFKDETDSVVRKFQTVQASMMVDVTRPFAYSVMNAATDAATSYFMNSFIKASPFDDYLPDLCTDPGPIGHAFKSALSTASVATLALRSRDHGLMFHAYRLYSVSLAQTNAALGDPVCARCDGTLATILLLGVFETTDSGPASQQKRSTHLLGALKLLGIRGEQQFQSKLGLQLFSHVANDIRMTYFQRKEAIPAELMILNRLVLPVLNSRDPVLSLSMFGDQVASLRLRSLTLSASSTDGVHDCITKAVSLDHTAISILQAFETDLPYVIRLTRDTHSLASSNPIYYYSSYRAVHAWNIVLLLRLTINEIIWECLSLVDAHGPAGNDGLPSTMAAPDQSYLRSLRTDVLQHARDIAIRVLACVPGFAEPDGCRTKFSISARILMWPLSTLSESPICPQIARATAYDYLIKLAADLNLPTMVKTSTKS